MPRATNAPATKARRKRILKKTRGYFGNKSRLYRYAAEALIRSERFAFRDRRKKKGEFRQLWIVRINAACRSHDIAYSRFMSGLKKTGIELDRKSLSEMAIHDEAAFAALVVKARAALDS